MAGKLIIVGKHPKRESDSTVLRALSASNSVLRAIRKRVTSFTDRLSIEAEEMRKSHALYQMQLYRTSVNDLAFEVLREIFERWPAMDIESDQPTYIGISPDSAGAGNLEKYRGFDPVANACHFSRLAHALMGFE